MPPYMTAFIAIYWEGMVKESFSKQDIFLITILGGPILIYLGLKLLTYI